MVDLIIVSTGENSQAISHHDDTWLNVFRSLGLKIKSEGRNIFVESNSSGKGEKMVEIAIRPDQLEIDSCHIYADLFVIKNRLTYSLVTPVYVDHSQMQLLLAKCEYLNERVDLIKNLINDKPRETNELDGNFFSNIIKMVPWRRFEIVPGTKWCGPGNIAKDYLDLGSKKDTDICCREHDHCGDSLTNGTIKYGLENNTPYTISACDCDEKFRQCLLKGNSVTSDIVGNLYFNALGMKCFKKAPKTIKCLQEDRWLLSKACTKYLFDHSSPNIYQFFDPLLYKRPADIILL